MCLQSFRNLNRRRSRSKYVQSVGSQAQLTLSGQAFLQSDACATSELLCLRQAALRSADTWQIFCSTSAGINVQKIFKIVLAKAFDLKVSGTPA